MWVKHTVFFVNLSNRDNGDKYGKLISKGKKEEKKKQNIETNNTNKNVRIDIKKAKTDKQKTTKNKFSSFICDYNSMNNYFKNTVTIKQNVENLIANSFFFHSFVDFPFANLPGTHPSNSIPLPPCLICAPFVSISTLVYSKNKNKQTKLQALPPPQKIRYDTIPPMWVLEISALF